MFDYPSLNPNTTAWLVYNECAPFPEAQIIQTFLDFDDTELVPLEPQGVTPYDRIVTLDANFTDINGINYAIINNQTYSPANVPTLFTALTTGQKALDPAEYGSNPNTFVLNYGDEVWIAINNFDTGNHPCKSPHMNLKFTFVSSSARSLFSSLASGFGGRRNIRSSESPYVSRESCPSRCNSGHGRRLCHYRNSCR